VWGGQGGNFRTAYNNQPFGFPNQNTNYNANPWSAQGYGQPPLPFSQSAFG